MNIWALEKKILNNQMLSPGEMHVVEEALSANEHQEQVLSCEALLRQGNSEQIGQAVQVLSRIVRDVNADQIAVTTNLIMTFFSVPVLVLAQPMFKSILERSAKHSDEGIRANTMVVLPRLAMVIDAGWAADLLKEGLKDPSEMVRQNAAAGLRQTSSL